MQYTAQEKSQTIFLYAQTQSYVQTRRRFRRQFNKNPPATNTIKTWLTKFRNTASISRKRRTVNGNLEEMLSVYELVQRNPKISIRKIASNLEMDKTKVFRILKVLKFKPYKIQVLQKINDRDHAKRVFMCETLTDLYRTYPNFRIIMSDEAAFHINGRVNKHNCRIWGLENPREFHQHERDSPKVNVWCAVSREKLYGPFFFAENTVRGNNYTDMLENFFYPQLEQDGILNQNVYFQQDGAPPHYSNIARESVNQQFGNNWIGRSGPIEWAPNSPDLTVPDFFVWGYVKDRVYNPMPATIEELKNNIRQVMENIPLEMLTAAFDNLMVRFHKCIDQEGRHIEHLF